MRDKIAINVRCECQKGCGLSTKSKINYSEIITDDFEYIIVDGCMNGPDPGDTLVSRSDSEGYSIYKKNI